MNDLTVDFASNVVPVDLNGDGIADLVAQGFTQNGSESSLVAWLGHPDGSFTQAAQIFTSSSSGTGLLAADFNRDGMIDILIPGTNNGEAIPNYAALYLNATPRAACATSAISPTVVACQPVDNTYIAGSSIPVQATAYDKTQVTALQEYLDGNLLYSQPVETLTTAFPANLGPHLLVTKAWDASGINFITNRHITVYDGTPGAVCTAAPQSAAICLPAGATTKAPVRILANGATVGVPTAAQLYIDGKLTINDLTHSTVLDTEQTLAAGPHQLVFKLWDARGNVYAATKDITAQ